MRRYPDVVIRCIWPTVFEVEKTASHIETSLQSTRGCVQRELNGRTHSVDAVERQLEWSQRRIVRFAHSL